MGTNNKMESRPMTIKDVLVDVMGILGRVKVSIDQMEEIGAPISRAISGIRICVDSIEKAEANAAKQEESPEDEEDDGQNVIQIHEITQNDNE